MLGAVLAHVRHIGGDAAVRQVLEAAGERRTAEEIEDPVGWSAHAQGLALFEAAAAVLGDPDIGRKAGAQVLRSYHGSETVTLLRSLGSPGELLRVYPAISAKQSAVTRAEVLDVGERHAVIAVETIPPIVRHRFFCDYTRGAIAEFPVLFGMERAQVDEVECQARGDRRCLLRVTWDPTSSVGRALDEEVAELRAQVQALTTRYEALEAVATELAEARDVDTMLDTVTRRAGVAVRAPRYLLVVRLPRDHDWRIHSVGFEPTEAAAAAHRVLAQPEPSAGRGEAAEAHGATDRGAVDDSAAGSDNVLAVEVASARTRFGRLACFYPPGFRFMPQERALLAAYAGHAAAALETAAALDEACERNETLGSLLALGTALSEATTAREVAQRIADAVPGLVGTPEAHVLLWDPGEATLTRAASSDSTGHRRPLPAANRLREPRLASRLSVTPGPTVVTAVSDPVLGALLELTGLPAAVSTPIITQGQLRGLVVASWDADSADVDAVRRERLAGIASLAATALMSVRLLDEARHLALHDALTDLPNSRLFEERLEQALASASRTGEQIAVLFLDLDRFKAVNDTYGHQTGDELLRAVADRLRQLVRSTDTVARMGGDEFAVILRDARDLMAVERLAGALVTAMSQPFALRGVTVEVGASVGVALNGPSPSACQSVVRRADAAMYLAKAAGRGCHRLDWDERPADQSEALPRRPIPFATR